jgi:hypothetical protein
MCSLMHCQSASAWKYLVTELTFHRHGFSLTPSLVRRNFVEKCHLIVLIEPLNLCFLNLYNIFLIAELFWHKNQQNSIRQQRTWPTDALTNHNQIFEFLRKSSKIPQISLKLKLLQGLVT